ncbi:unnamed protein product, partial [Pylaiella littoralis]
EEEDDDECEEVRVVPGGGQTPAPAPGELKPKKKRVSKKWNTLYDLVLAEKGVVGAGVTSMTGDGVAGKTGSEGERDGRIQVQVRRDSSSSSLTLAQVPPFVKISHEFPV